MSPFWIDIIMGLFAGAVVGLFAAALCVIAARNDTHKNGYRLYGHVHTRRL